MCNGITDKFCSLSQMDVGKSVNVEAIFAMASLNSYIFICSPFFHQRVASAAWPWPPCPPRSPVGSQSTGRRTVRGPLLQEDRRAGHSYGLEWVLLGRLHFGGLQMSSATHSYLKHKACTVHTAL